MSDDLFAFDDVAGAGASLASLPPDRNDRLWARVLRGESPLASAAELARRGDLRPLRALVGAAAWVAPEDLAMLVRAGDVGVDALAAVALAAWLPVNARVAAVEALHTAPVTAASLAALTELASGPRQPPAPQASAALGDVTARASKPLRDEAERLRGVAKQLRDGVRGVIHRQQFQRAVAGAALHPIVGMLTGDDGAFLAGLLPPLVDDAREGLVAPLLTVLRAPGDDARAKVLGFLQRRWRELAALPLSCAARTPSKHKESAASLAAVKALAAMGALDELAAVVGSATGAVKQAAATELTKALPRAGGDVDRALVDAAMARVRG